MVRAWILLTALCLVNPVKASNSRKIPRRLMFMGGLNLETVEMEATDNIVNLTSQLQEDAHIKLSLEGDTLSVTGDNSFLMVLRKNILFYPQKVFGGYYFGQNDDVSTTTTATTLTQPTNNNDEHHQAEGPFEGWNVTGQNSEHRGDEQYQEQDNFDSFELEEAIRLSTMPSDSYYQPFRAQSRPLSVYEREAMGIPFGPLEDQVVLKDDDLLVSVIQVDPSSTMTIKNLITALQDIKTMENTLNALYSLDPIPQLQIAIHMIRPFFSIDKAAKTTSVTTSSTKKEEAVEGSKLSFNLKVYLHNSEQATTPITSTNQLSISSKASELSPKASAEFTGPDTVKVTNSNGAVALLLREGNNLARKARPYDILTKIYHTELTEKSDEATVQKGDIVVLLVPLANKDDSNATNIRDICGSLMTIDDDFEDSVKDVFEYYGKDIVALAARIDLVPSSGSGSGNK